MKDQQGKGMANNLTNYISLLDELMTLCKEYNMLLVDWNLEQGV